MSRSNPSNAKIFRKAWVCAALAVGSTNTGLCQSQPNNSPIVLPAYQPGIQRVLVLGGIESATANSVMPRMAALPATTPQAINTVLVQERARSAPLTVVQPPASAPAPVIVDEQRVVPEPLVPNSSQPPRTFEPRGANIVEAPVNQATPYVRQQREPERDQQREPQRGEERRVGPRSDATRERDERRSGPEMRPQLAEPRGFGPLIPPHRGPEGPGNPMLRGGMMAGGMDPAQPNRMPGNRSERGPGGMESLDSIEHILRSPAFQQILQLKEENIQLKANMRVQQLESEMRLRELELRNKLEQQERRMDERRQDERRMDERRQDERRAQERGAEMRPREQHRDADRPRESAEAVAAEQSAKAQSLKAEVEEYKQLVGKIRAELEKVTNERVDIERKLNHVNKERMELERALAASKRAAEHQALEAERLAKQARDRDDKRREESRKAEGKKERDSEKRDKERAAPKGTEL